MFIYLYDGEGISCVFEKTLVLAAQLARMQCQAAGCDQFPLCRHLAPVQRISKQIHFVSFFVVKQGSFSLASALHKVLP